MSNQLSDQDEAVQSGYEDLIARTFGSQINYRRLNKPLKTNHRLQYLTVKRKEGLEVAEYELNEVLWFGDAEYTAEIIQQRGHQLTGSQIAGMPIAV